MDKIIFNLFVKLIKEYKNSASNFAIRHQRTGDKIADEYFGKAKAYEKVLDLLKEISGEK